MVVSPSNMPWTVATVIPTSTSAGPASFRPEIEINGKRTRLLIDQLRTIDTAYIRDLAAIPSREEIAAAELALARYLGIAAAGGWLEPQEQGEIG
jgi:mRNA interferase MazF